MKKMRLSPLLLWLMPVWASKHLNGSCMFPEIVTRFNLPCTYTISETACFSLLELEKEVMELNKY